MDRVTTPYPSEATDLAAVVAAALGSPGALTLAQPLEVLGANVTLTGYPSMAATGDVHSFVADSTNVALVRLALAGC